MADGLVMNELKTELLEVHVQILSQDDIRTAWYALAILADNEKDETKAAALRRVESALWDITNWYGVEAIGSDAIIGDREYLPRKKEAALKGEG